jgi:hypothetical protein
MIMDILGRRPAVWLPAKDSIYIQKLSVKCFLMPAIHLEPSQKKCRVNEIAKVFMQTKKHFSIYK